MVYKQYTVIQYPYQNPIMLPFANSSKMSSDVKLDRIQRPGRKIGEDKWLADTFLYQKVCSVLKKNKFVGKFRMKMHLLRNAGRRDVAELEKVLM